MGIARRMIPSADLIVTVWDGTVTPTEWSTAVREQIAAAELTEASLRITDARTADTSQLGMHDVDAVTTELEQSRQSMANIKLAIVVNADWPTARRVESTMSRLGTTTVAFDGVHAACAWLGINPDTTLATIEELRRELRGTAA